MKIYRRSSVKIQEGVRGKNIVTSNVLSEYHQVIFRVIAGIFESICLHSGFCFIKSFCARKYYLKLYFLSPGGNFVISGDEEDRIHAVS